MDPRFLNFGFSVNNSNAFKNLVNKSIEVNGGGAAHSMDTILRLDFPGSPNQCMSASQGIKRKWSSIDGSMGPKIGSALCLGLGRLSSSSDSKGSSATACTVISSPRESIEESSMEIELDFSLHLGNDKLIKPKKSVSSNLNTLDIPPIVDLNLSLSTGPSDSGLTSGLPNPTLHEGSTSSKWKSPLFMPQLNRGPSFLFSQIAENINPNPTITIPVPDISSSLITPKSSVTCTSGISQQQHQRSNSSKICQIEGCGKGARGASGRCIGHGGGRRCQRPNCPKGAEGRTVYCKAHGGGRRCEHLGCTKSAEGRTDFCIAHGGGRRCSSKDCGRAARGKSGLCIKHGGGKRCQNKDCTKSAEGLSGLCISHGGGRRCQYLECTKGAQGSTLYCKAHGGGKRCTYVGCNKGAEGSTPFCKGHGGGKRCSYQGGGICSKSVHGGTLFCVAHGGGKRCAVPDCTKSARGRTDYCVRHGGGKRCKFDKCGKSAQGSTDFCKAHGGGKRCSWGYPGSEFGQNDAPCFSFARGRTGLCASHSALVQDKRVHGGATLGTMVHDPKPGKLEKLKEPMSFDAINSAEFNGLHINRYRNSSSELLIREGGPASVQAFVPEGRVHGGSLMAMLAGNSLTGGGPSEPSKSFIPQNWI